MLVSADRLRAEVETSLDKNPNLEELLGYFGCLVRLKELRDLLGI